MIEKRPRRIDCGAYFEGKWYKTIKEKGGWRMILSLFCLSMFILCEIITTWIAEGITKIIGGKI